MRRGTVGVRLTTSVGNFARFAEWQKLDVVIRAKASNYTYVRLDVDVEISSKAEDRYGGTYARPMFSLLDRVG